ncbi:MAG: TM2 domain-containing protein [Erysipelotrichia bacterium]|nr:hypothetical protein [Bacilli bacterium]NLB49875.1 TM2 domain-containing protein [Erysipelotrichia bacterium]
MPNCRKCNTRLTKFEKDICPVCGCKNPLEGMTSETMEITAEISAVGDLVKDYHPKTRTACFVLSILFGWTGAVYFYLRKVSKGIVWLLINLVLLGGLFTAFYFLNLDWLAYLLPIVIVYIFNIAMAFRFFYAMDYRDGQGNFLK